MISCVGHIVVWNVSQTRRIQNAADLHEQIRVVTVGHSHQHTEMRLQDPGERVSERSTITFGSDPMARQPGTVLV